MKNSLIVSAAIVGLLVVVISAGTVIYGMQHERNQEIKNEVALQSQIKALKQQIPGHEPSKVITDLPSSFVLKVGENAKIPYDGPGCDPTYIIKNDGEYSVFGRGKGVMLTVESRQVCADGDIFVPWESQNLTLFESQPDATVGVLVLHLQGAPASDSTVTLTADEHFY